MPQNLDFTLYFNIAFFSVLGLGMLFGFLRGMKKAMFAFIRTLIFYVIFFLTIDIVVTYIWNGNIPFLGNILGGYMPELSGITKVSEALPLVLQKFLGIEYEAVYTNPNLLAFLGGLALFVVKIVWTILYFTIINLIFRLIFFLIRIIFFRKNKETDKFKSKNRGMGAVFGLLSGAMTVYVTLIIFGGIIDISASISQIAPPSTGQVSQMSLEFPREDYLDPSMRFDLSFSPIIDPDSLGIDEAIDLINDMVTSYDSNIIVQYANKLTIPSMTTGEEEPLNLFLFDKVLSINLEDTSVSFREEINIYTNVFSAVMNSDFMESGNLSDIQGDDIRAVFTELSDSNLISTILPIAIDVGADYINASDTLSQSVDITLTDDEIYGIDWKQELMQLGEVAATGFDIINAAGVLNDTSNLTNMAFDGDEVETLFTELGESQLITLAAYKAINPLLESLGPEVQSIITVPDDIVWEDEFAAFGAIAGSVLNSGITIGDVESGSVTELVTTLANVDFTVLLNSKIVTNGLINILSGTADIGLGDTLTSFLEIPDDIVWLDVYDNDGNITENGELRNILVAINSVVDSASLINLDDPQISDIANLDVDTINTIFESRILVASVSKQITQLDLGEDFPLVIPDSVFDDDGYILKTELQNVVTAIQMAATELACSVDDDACNEVGFDFQNVFSLTGDNIDTLLASDILSATVGSLLLDLGSDVLTIPNSVITEILVDGVSQDVVSKLEIKNVFGAVSALGITDINNIAVDASILQNLALENDSTNLDQDKADQLFGSKILLATLSQYLLDFTTGDSSFIVVPYKDVEGNDILTEDATDGISYISETELSDILQGILSLDITDFNNFDSLDLNTIIDNSSTLLNSAILHATISKQIFDLGGDILTVPYFAENSDPIRITVGDTGKETEYIAKDELENAFDALGVLGISDINNFDGNIDLADIMSDSTKVDTLLDSTIIQATISQQVLDLTGDGLIEVPYVNEDESLDIRVTVGTGEESTEYITKDEIKNVLDALNALGITDVTTFSGSIDLSLLSDETVVNTVLASSTIQATISKQLIDLDTDQTLVVPFYANDGLDTPIRVTVGETGFETEYIVNDELKSIFDALDVLGISDVESFTGSIDLSVLAEDDNADTVLASSVIQATVSKQVFDIADGDTLIVPYYQEDDQTKVRNTVGSDEKATEYIDKLELKAMILSLDVLGLTDVNSFSGSVDLSLFSDEAKVNQLLESSSIQATISKQVIDLDDTSGSLVVPYLADDDQTNIRILTGPVGFETTYIKKTEIKNLIDSMNILGITDVESFTGSIDLSVLSDETSKATVLSSSVIQATISEQLFSLADGDTIQIPELSETGGEVVKSSGEGLEETNFIVSSELSKVFTAMDILNITDVESFTGSVDLHLLATGDNAEGVFASDIIQATVSKQILDLDTSDTIQVPYLADDDSTDIRITVGAVGDEFEYVAKTELVAIVKALDILNITDVNSFGGTIDLTNFYDQGNRTILLNSSIMQATISEQVLGLGTDAITVPIKSADDSEFIRLTVGEVGKQTEYILKPEIHALFEAMELLNITDIESFTGTVSLNKFFASLDAEYDTNQDTLLASASMQATISKQMTDLGSGVLTIPTTDIDDDPIQTTVSGTLFIVKSEIKHIINAMDILGINDITSFTGTVSLANFFASQEPADYDTNQNILLASASMHATISKQINDLGTGVLTVPTVDVLGATIKTTVSTNDFIVKSEIKDIINAMDILGINDITSFTGTVSLSNFFASQEPADYDANQDTLLASASMHATISKQINDLGSGVLTVPTVDVLGATIKTTVATNDFIVKSEIKDIINAMDILGINDITSFTGTVSLSNFFASQEPADYDANQDTLLASASMHATISKQINDLGSAVLTVPTVDVLGATIKTTVETNDFIVKSEIMNIINAMDILGINDITSFTGTVSLTKFFASQEPADYDTNQNTLLASASMHATISKQITDLGPSVLDVPTTDIDDNAVKLTVQTNDFLSKTEIKHLIDAMDILGINDITSFTGTVSLTNFFASQEPTNYSTNQDTLLASASMHKTITNQITNLGSSVLDVPDNDIDNVSVKDTVSGNYFITKSEIKHLIDAMDVLNIGDITSFTGTISLGALSGTSDQNTVLLSASMHKTITNKLLGLGQAVLIVPNYSQDGESAAYEIRKTVTSDEFIVKAEIKAIINAFVDMGYSDLSSFGSSIDSSKFFTNPDLYLLSSSIHATLSYKLLNETGGNIIVPDTNINDDPDSTIRIIQTDVTYIEINETKALLAALDELNLTNFSAIDITTNKLFAADTDILLASVSMQATISDKILAGATDEFNATNSKLIVPTYFREAILVATSSETWIEKTELKNLIKALDVVGVNDFSGAVSASAFSTMSGTDIDTMLASGSMHTTIDYMLKQNSNINTSIPNIAKTDSEPYLTGIITKTEIKAFIIATQQLGSDISNFNIQFTDLGSLTPTQQDTVLSSIIVRCKLTPDLITAAPLAGVILGPSDYETGSDIQTMIKATALDIIQ